MITEEEFASKCEAAGMNFTECFIKTKAETDGFMALVAMSGALAACAILEKVSIDKILAAVISAYNDIKESKLT